MGLRTGQELPGGDGLLGTTVLVAATGRMTYPQHTADRPMCTLWHIHRPLPADIFHAARVAAA